MAKYWKKWKAMHFIHCCMLCDKYRQLFISIDIKEAKERGFKFVRNVYGDEINHLNCRSIWVDKKNRAWCVEQLNT